MVVVPHLDRLVSIIAAEIARQILYEEHEAKRWNHGSGDELKKATKAGNPLVSL
jgi:hypothetical protein